MHARVLALAMTAGTALPAYAHGEEVLTYFYAQGLIVVAVLLLIRFVPTFRLHSIAGVVGCAAGVVASWLLTADLQYPKNQFFITTVGIVTPPAFAALFVYLARRYASK